MQPSGLRLQDPEMSTAIRAAWLYYVGGHNQGEVASRLGVSAAKANRLIAKAQQRGAVKIYIEGGPVECIALENDLASRFGLSQCIVVPSLGQEGDGDAASDFAAVGVAGAHYLNQYIASSQQAVIGLGKGRSLTSAVSMMRAIDRPDLKFVSVSGSLTRNMSINPLDVLHKLVDLTGGKGFFLPVPYIADSVEEKNVMLAQKSVRDVLSLARSADIFVIGVGSLADDAHVRQAEMVTDGEWAELKRVDAVGDLMGSYLDANGDPVDSDVNQRSVGLHIDDLRHKHVVAIVGGAGKGAAVLSALRSGIITDLIVSETTAKVALEQQSPGGNR